MSHPTVTRNHVDATASPSRRRVRPASLVGAVLAVAVAAGAVGRFAFVGHRSAAGSSRSAAVTAPTDRIATLEARVAANAADAPAWQSLAAAYVAAANATGDPARYDAARRAVDRARALAPDAVRTLVAGAIVELGVHDFAAASVDAERAVALDRYDADALVAAVDAAVELGDYDRAAARLQTLLDLRPGAPALARASYLQELHGDLTGARSAMARAEAATTAGAERASIATYAGDVALAAGDVDAAAAAYERALTLEPGRVGAALGRARVLLAGGDLTAARAATQTVLDHAPVPAAAALAADLADLAGDRDGAALARQLVAANIALVSAAGVAVDLEAALDATDHGDPVAAVALAQRAYDTRHTVFTADALGWALTRAGRAADATPYVEESLRLGTASASLRLHAASAFAALGRADDARRELAASTALSPWPAFHLRPVAVRLAAALDVSLPPVWRP